MKVVKTKALAALATGLVLAFTSYSLAQPRVPVTIVLPNDSTVPFDLKTTSSGPMMVRYCVFLATYSSDCTEWGNVFINVGGTKTLLPVSQIARAQLLQPGTETEWQFTLNDGREFVGFRTNSQAFLWISGTNQFGVDESFKSYAGEPNAQPFTGLVLDPAAAAADPQAAARTDADSVMLRNGDVLSGNILTDEFTVSTSYGTLTFTQDQLASIAIEDAAGRTDQFVLKVGDRVSGVLQNATVELTLTTGATITLEKGNIASITFARD